MTKSNFQDLLNAAASNFSNFSSNEASRLSSSDKELYAALADIVAVRECLKFNDNLTDDEEEDYDATNVQYCQFLTVCGVKVKDSQLSKSHPLVRALMPEDLRDQFRSKISLYGQVVDILVKENIKSVDVVEWLSTPIHVNGFVQPVSGLKKAQAKKTPTIGKKPRSQPKQAPANDNCTAEVIINAEPSDLGTQLAFGGELYVGTHDETGKVTFTKVNYTPEQLLAAVAAASETNAIVA